MMNTETEETKSGDNESCHVVDMRSTTAGESYLVHGMDVAGLRLDTTTTRFYARGNTVVLNSTLSEKSTLLQGPPGSGKSTFVWYWLQRFVVKTQEPAVWFQFDKQRDDIGCVMVTPHENNCAVQFTEIVDKDPFTYVAENYKVDHCVVDGVRESSLGRAAASWKVFGRLSRRQCRTKHMVWVSSQQLVIPGEMLINTNTEEHVFLSWKREDIDAFAATFADTEKEAFKRDAQLVLKREDFGGVNGRQILHSFEEAVEFKFWLFGGNVKWIFAMTTSNALDDLGRFLSKVDDAEKLNAGLQGVRGDHAVNHVVGQYDNGVIQIISGYALQNIAKRVGLKAISVMYNSPWVRGNPSVHGFVFEWDIFVQVDTMKRLNLIHPDGRDIVWPVDEDVNLHHFVKHGVTTSRMMIRPPKWNHPEYDGLYLTRDNEGKNHLIAWNASEATSHKGKVDKLVVLLRELSMRTVSICFDTVRFVFIVPDVALKTFQLPGSTETLQAKQVLSCANWGFSSFEVLGLKPSSPGE